MLIKRFIALLLILSMVLTFTGVIYAKNSHDAEISKYVEKIVTDAYTPYYKINSISTKISGLVIDNKTLTAEINISMTKTLKYNKVDDLPYIKGMKDALKNKRNEEDTKVADKVLKDEMKTLKEYIGTPTEQNDTFKISVDISNDKIDFDTAKLEFLGVDGYIPAQYFIPNTENEMYKEGNDSLTEAIDSYKFCMKKASPIITGQVNMLSTAQTTTIKYDRIAARDYANTYTSETGDSYDTDYWNPDYTWHTENGGVDCANYVSQAITAGGIPKDTTWYKDSLTWLNAYKLPDYMVQKGYFFKTTRSKCAAGGFIQHTDFAM